MLTRYVDIDARWGNEPALRTTGKQEHKHEWLNAPGEVIRGKLGNLV